MSGVLDWRETPYVYFDPYSLSPCINYSRLLHPLRHFRSPPPRLPVSLVKLRKGFHKTLSFLVSPTTSKSWTQCRRSRCPCPHCAWVYTQHRRRIERHQRRALWIERLEDFIAIVLPVSLLIFLVCFFLYWVIGPYRGSNLRVRVRSLGAVDESLVLDKSANAWVSTNTLSLDGNGSGRPTIKERFSWCRQRNNLEAAYETLAAYAQPLGIPVTYLEDSSSDDDEAYCAPPLSASLFELDQQADGYQLLDNLRCSTSRLHSRLTHQPTFKPLSIGISTQVQRIAYAEIASGTWGVMLSQWLVWKDPRLSYSGTSVCNDWDSEVDFIPMGIDRSEGSTIWAPDMFTLNTADDETWSSAMGTMESARVYDANFSATHGFNVAWKTTLTAKAVCDFDFSRFPFDEQVCSSLLGPLAYNSRYIRLYPRRFPLANETFVDSDWSTENSTFMFQSLGSSTDLGIMNWQTSVYNRLGEPAVTPGNNTHAERQGILDVELPYIEVAILFRREGSYYLLNFVFPMIVMWLLAYATFFLPFEEHDRVSIIMSVVWTITTIMFLTADARPSNFQDSWIDSFQAGSLVLCIFPALEAVMVARLKTHIQDSIDHSLALYEHARAVYKTKMRQVHLEALRKEFNAQDPGESQQRQESSVMPLSGPVYPNGAEPSQTGNPYAKLTSRSPTTRTVTNKFQRVATHNAEMPESTYHLPHPNSQPRLLTRRASVMTPEDVAKGLAVFRERMRSGNINKPRIGSAGDLVRVATMGDAHSQFPVAFSATDLTHLGPHPQLSPLTNIASSLVSPLSVPLSSPVWSSADNLARRASVVTLVDLESLGTTGGSEGSDSTSWDEYDAFLPPPPEPEDAGIISNLIDHIFQVGYPGLLAMFIIQRLSPITVHTYLIKAFWGQGGPRQSTGARIMVTMVMSLFVILWILAVFSYVSSLSHTPYTPPADFETYSGFSVEYHGTFESFPENSNRERRMSVYVNWVMWECHRWRRVQMSGFFVVVLSLVYQRSCVRRRLTLGFPW
eukprot:Blabericola_migrator_1__2852@NODE_1817_length_3743_cov_56_668118_g1167_i0_p1_GENE_NODE_1817_length_3743_cov_56_668118_g1167_i0NODE_1817_length_3743_cov_56_668118_g1167_i0_p1_ORF_typecomplete_len1025_score149_06Neur_chan_LBD/PF02931_23/2_1e15Neur_chan_memb/PF02932_16/3_4e06Neur_chan_memb/PF02932_16/3_4e02DUF443/PF04276_12/2_1e02DUF443/PF04276_12/1_5DUF443/PF04276_12/1_2e03_NODE_1817_length_3743_cov_56_668118_g1167_i0293076